MTILQPKYTWNGNLTKRRATQYIILHHAAGNGSPEGVHAYHRDHNGWVGIGYNFYVRKDGKVYQGRPTDCTGAHTVGYNDISVGVCFEGNFETETMSAAQTDAGRELIQTLVAQYPAAQIKRHKDLASTACPGKNFPIDEVAAAAGGIHCYWTTPKRIEIYVNDGTKTATDVAKDTGGIVINGGLYDMRTYKPVCRLKVDGKVLTTDTDRYYGYAWDSGQAMPDLVTDYTTYDNYICCVCLVRNGKPEQLYSNTAGVAKRTGMGRKGNTMLGVVCTTDSITAAEFQTWALKQGFDDFIMLDGGGSTQGVTPDWTVTSIRPVHNYIVVNGAEKQCRVTVTLPKDKADALAGEMINRGYKALITSG